MHDILVIYHSADFDGLCSLAIAREFFKEGAHVIYHGMNYGGTIPEEYIHKDCTVYMCDFSLQPWVDMISLAKRVAKLYWIDHHKTAFDSYKSTEEESKAAGIVNVNKDFDTSLGACARVWEYLYAGQPMPKPVRLLAEYDVWNHKDPQCLPFQYGLRLYTDRVAKSAAFSQLLTGYGGPAEEFVAKICAEGNTVTAYLEQQNARDHKSMFTLNFEGVKFLALNGNGNSITFDKHRDRKQHDACLLFRYNGRHKHWVISMYSDTHDVSPIAKKYGGGGHAGACGFSCDQLPFTFPE